MNREDFLKYIEELQNFYGQKLSQTELEVWYDNLKTMTMQRFNLILSEIYKTSKFMPKLADILQVHNQIPYTATQPEKKMTGHCEKCNDTGYVTYYKDIDGMKYQYAAVCDCGRQKTYNGRECIDPKNKSDYFIPTANEINIDVKTTKPTKEQVLSSMQKLKNSPIISEQVKEIIRREYKKLA